MFFVNHYALAVGFEPTMENFLTGLTVQTVRPLRQHQNIEKVIRFELM
jgi:hypothetical protein